MNEAALLEILSGERRGVVPAMARGGLSLLTVPYRLAVAARNAAFDLGLLPSYAAGVPVVSVGNLTTGGTGKTPFVAETVARLAELGRQPAILSRGYRALEGAANDEKLVLDRLCPGVPHVQQPDRVAGARLAVEGGANVLVLDDGFQHRRLRRNLDLVLVDALNPFGYGRLLPRGLLREPLTAIRRASAVVITRADQVSDAEIEQIEKTLKHAAGPKKAAALPVIHVAYPPAELLGTGGEREPIDRLRGRRVVAFCGIGNPAGFAATLAAAGATLAAEPERALLAFPDHHHYTPADMQRVNALADELGAELIVTTLKDLVKLTDGITPGFPVRAVGIGAQVVRGEAELDALLAELPEAPSYGA